MVTTFISYAREDQQLALRLYQDLKKVGTTPWMDSENILPGQNWENEIRKSIRSCDYFIPIFSKNSVGKRGYFQAEVRIALDELRKVPPDQISLIPCRVEDVTILHEELRELHWLDLFPSYVTGFRKLLLSMGLTPPNEDELENYRELIKQVEQNIFRYKLSEAKNILSEPRLFQTPTWITEILIKTDKTLRRFYEAITRVQRVIQMYHYTAREIGGQRFVLQFKHDKEYNEFISQFEDLLKREGVEILDVKTKKNEIPKEFSALIIPTDDAESVMIRAYGGRMVFSSPEGDYDADTGEKLRDEELASLRPFSIGKK